jgi:Condensation domain
VSLTGVASAPLSFGQLWVLRTAELLTPEEQAQAHLCRVAPLPAGLSVADVTDVLTTLRARHEALRTTYDLSDPTAPRQVVHRDVDFALPVEQVAASSPDDAAEVADRVATDLENAAFDLTREQPWRAAIVVVDGRPTHLAIVLHHIAVDLAALDLLAADFEALLGQKTLPAPASQLELALTQHSEQWAPRRRDTEQYLRGTLTLAGQAPPRGIVESGGETRRVTLHSRTAVPAATAKAERLGISLPSLVAAAYGFSLHQLTGADHVLLHLMSANRLYPGTERLVASVCQLVPLSSVLGDGESFDAYAKRMHWETLRAYRRGSFDTDLEQRIRREVESTVGPIQPAFFFNYMEDNAVPASVDEDDGTVPAWRIEHGRGPNSGGPDFGLAVTRNPGLKLLVRTRWAGLDDAAVESFVVGLHDLLH